MLQKANGGVMEGEYGKYIEFMETVWPQSPIEMRKDGSADIQRVI